MDLITTQYSSVIPVEAFQNCLSVTSFQAWIEQVFTAGHLCGVGEMLRVCDLQGVAVMGMSLMVAMMNDVTLAN